MIPLTPSTAPKAVTGDTGEYVVFFGTGVVAMIATVVTSGVTTGVTGVILLGCGTGVAVV